MSDAMPAFATPAPRPRLPGRVTSVLPLLRYVLIVVAVVLILWQVLITVFAIPPFVAPTPLSVLQALVTDAGDLAIAIAYTLRSTLGGIVLAVLLAVTVAGLFTLSPLASRAFLPLIIILRTAPILAIAPILILIFGRGQATSIAVVVMVSFFPIMVNAAKGFRSPRANAMELMHVIGASWAQTFVKVRLPYAVPFIFTGIRMASAGAVLSAMLAEWLSGAPGIGTLILEASSFRNLPLMWAGVVVSMAAATGIYGLTVAIEKRLTR